MSTKSLQALKTFCIESVCREFLHLFEKVRTNLRRICRKPCQKMFFNFFRKASEEVGLICSCRQHSDNFSTIDCGYTIKLLLSNYSLHMESIRTFLFSTYLISFYPYLKTAVRVFCCMTHY